MESDDFSPTGAASEDSFSGTGDPALGLLTEMKVDVVKESKKSVPEVI